MSDEREESSGGGPELNRRDFLQVSFASAVFAPSLLDEYAETLDAESQGGGPLAKKATELGPPPTERRDYFPLESELVSVRGLTPPREAETKSQGSEVWGDEGTISLRNLASWRHNVVRDAVFDQGVPHSVRELITPQRELIITPPYGGDGWKNWLDDHETPVRELQVTNVGAAFSSESGEVESAHHDGRERAYVGVNTFYGRSPEKVLLKHVVRFARRGYKFRAVGSGHSHSEAAKPTAYFTNMREVRGKLEQKWLWDDDDDFWKGNDSKRGHQESDPNKNHLIRVGAGTILKRLNRDILPAENLALPNMGSFDGQTVAGAINTSTHGTGLELGTFADLVQSVEIVCVPESQYEQGTPHVRMLRVEPEDGITDPEKFAADADSHGMALIQNDDLFHSVVVGYGCMGIVYAYTLKVRDAFWLEEDTTLKDWNTLKSKLTPSEDNADDETKAQAVRDFVTKDDTRHFQILLNIAAEQVPDDKLNDDNHEGPHNPVCMVRRHYEREPPGVGKDGPKGWKTRIIQGNDTRWPPERRKKTAQDFGKWFFNNLHPLKPNTGKAKQLHSKFFHPAENRPPFVAKKSETASYIALRRLRDRDHFPPKPPTLATSMEVAVPLEELVDAVDWVRGKVQDVRQKHWVSPPTEKRQKREYDVFFGVPMGIRFTASSEHVLSPEFERPSAMIELPFPIYEDGADADLRSGVPNLSQEELRDEVAKPALKEIEKGLVSKFDGRPHLGKQNSVHVSSETEEFRPQEMYPEYYKWTDAYEYLNKFGMFDGEFSENKVGYKP